MRRHLAKTLWIFCAGMLAAGGCAGNGEAPRQNGSTPDGHSAAASEDHGSDGVPAAAQGAPPTATAEMRPSAQPAEGGETVAEEHEFSGDVAVPVEAEPPAPPPAADEASRVGSRRDRKAKVRSRAAVSSGALGGVAHGRGAALGAPAPRPARKPMVIVKADPRDSNTEDYRNHGVNPMVSTAEDKLSTFAVDVDTASYVIARRKLNENGSLPRSAVRVEEFVNYFRYDYAGPSNDQPFAVHMDAAPSPFTTERHIVRIGVQAKKVARSERKPAHLTFLVDVSGSMGAPDKLPLAKRALRVLVNNLNDSDTVALVTYAGNTRLVLPPTGLGNRGRIMAAIEGLDAGGSTAMASGIELAYQQAAKNLGPNSESRVIVLSDGDANVGATSHDTILKRIAGKVKEGVTLSTIGFGMGNYKDHMMEQLANKGNGNYYYIDGVSQAKRVFQEQLGGTLEVVAKDVKIQVEWNPDAVKRYRLVGYENRDVADRDFRNDKVDAGEIGAGHTVTAMYEVELVKGNREELGTVRLRAKKPRGTKAAETAYLLPRNRINPTFAAASSDFRFASAVMAGAEILRGSAHAKDWSLGQVVRIATAAAGDDRDREEFVGLMKRASRRPVAAR